MRATDHALAAPTAPAARLDLNPPPLDFLPPVQTLLAVPLVGLYMGGAACVRALEARRAQQA